MTVTYQPVLVLLSIGVAILGSLTALALTSGSDDSENDSWLSSFALANGGLIMGGTIWSMHFIAMMAVDFPILVNYNLVETITSICIAIGASMAALWFAFYKRGFFMTLAGGVVQGLAIASMHYTAMAATYFVPLGVSVELSTPLFAQSLLAYLIACGIVVVSVGNLGLLALLSMQQNRSA